MIFYGTHRTHVFTAHDHINQNIAVAGIQYLSMDAMVTDGVDTNAYSVVHLYDEGYIYVEGYGSQASYLRQFTSSPGS